MCRFVLLGPLTSKNIPTYACVCKCLTIGTRIAATTKCEEFCSRMRDRAHLHLCNTLHQMKALKVQKKSLNNV